MVSSVPGTIALGQNGLSGAWCANQCARTKVRPFLVSVDVQPTGSADVSSIGLCFFLTEPRGAHFLFQRATMFLSLLPPQDADARERLIAERFAALQQAALEHSVRAQAPARADAAAAAPERLPPALSGYEADDGTRDSFIEDERDERLRKEDDQMEIRRHAKKQEIDRIKKIIMNECRDADTKTVLEIKQVTWTKEHVATKAAELLRTVLVDFIQYCVAAEGLPPDEVKQMIVLWVETWNARRAFVEMFLSSDFYKHMAEYAEMKRMSQWIQRADDSIEYTDEDFRTYVERSRLRMFHDKKREVVRQWMKTQSHTIDIVYKMQALHHIGVIHDPSSALETESKRETVHQLIREYLQGSEKHASYLSALQAWSAKQDVKPAPPFHPPKSVSAWFSQSLHERDPIISAWIVKNRRVTPFSCWDTGMQEGLERMWEEDERERERAFQSVAVLPSRQKSARQAVAMMVAPSSKRYVSDWERRARAATVWREDLQHYAPARWSTIAARSSSFTQ
jgi:hypothetical protein